MSASRSIVTIAERLSHASTEDIPLILLLLRDVLEGKELTAKEKQLVRRQIWRCDLLHIIVEVLRRDFTLVSGQWSTASQLATLLGSICVSLRPSLAQKRDLTKEQAEQVAEFHDILLPAAVDSLLVLANNLMELAVACVENSDPKPHFIASMEALSWLCGDHRPSVQRALQSPYLLNILISDEAAYCGAAVGFIRAALDTDPVCFTTLPASTVQSTLDELVYKMTGGDGEVAVPALELLGTFVARQLTTAGQLLTAYKGLSAVVEKWSSHQLDLNGQGLLGALEQRAEGEKEANRIASAALVIQAAWRGYVCRQRMRRAQNGVRRFQALYRRWRSKKEARWKVILPSSTYTIRREFHERQIELVKQLDAGKVESYVREQEQRAAVKVQAWWRGLLARKQVRLRRADVVRNESARVIQRAIRRYLNRCNRPSSKDMVYPEITCSQRDALQSEVQEMMEHHPAFAQSDEQRRVLHDHVQHLLGEFYASLRQSVHKRELLLAQLAEDSDFALNAPPLVQSSEELVEQYTSGSRAVATMAQMAHKEELKAMLLPWWKRQAEGDLTDIDPLSTS